MSVTFIDSSVLIAAVSQKDAHYETGREVLLGIDAGDLPTTRLSNYVVAEVLNYIHAKKRHSEAVDLYDRLAESAGFEIVHASRQDYIEAIETFEKHDRLSFVDASSVAYMRREELTYIYSFDDDFDGLEGIVRLNAPDSPFG